MSDYLAENDETKKRYSALCQNCGACCSYYAHHNFQVPISLKGSQPPPRLVQIGPKILLGDEITTRYLRRVVRKDKWRVCAALDGFVGESVSCKIYEQRPSACVEFDPGSERCLHVRKWAGMDAGVANEQQD